MHRSQSDCRIATDCTDLRQIAPDLHCIVVQDNPAQSRIAILNQIALDCLGLHITEPDFVVHIVEVDCTRLRRIVTDCTRLPRITDYLARLHGIALDCARLQEITHEYTLLSQI